MIIGASGLVGSTLVKNASPHYDIHATFNDNIIKMEGIAFTRINLLEDRFPIVNLIKKLNPDVVVNTAAHSSVDLCETNPQLADLLHVDVTKDIAIACNEINSKCIHFSTDAVFDGNSNRKYTEEDESNPINHYGKTRLIAEKIIMEASNSNVILRTAIIYGWHTTNL